MKINFLTNINSIKPNFATTRPIINNLSSDVFVRSVPSFKSQDNSNDDLSFESFNDWVLKTNYLHKVEENPENAKGLLLGAGFEGAVYEIPDTDNWVIKEHKRSSIIPLKSEKPTIVKIDDIIPNMNVGQTIATLRIPCGKNYSYAYYIRKRQTGHTLGVDPKDINYVHSYNINGHLASLKLLAQAPQSTFDKLIADLSKIYDSGYEVDCSNLNNFLFDDKNNSINFVDINDKHKNQGNQFGDVLYSLLDTEFYSSFDENIAEEKEAKELSLKYCDSIVNKFLAAMKNNNSKFVFSPYFERLLSTDLLSTNLSGVTAEERLSNLKKNGLITC